MMKFSSTMPQNDSSHLAKLQKEKEKILQDMRAQEERRKMKLVQNTHKERPIIKLAEVNKPIEEVKIKKFPQIQAKSFSEIMADAQEKELLKKRHGDRLSEIPIKKQKLSSTHDSNKNHDFPPLRSINSSKTTSKTSNGSSNINERSLIKPINKRETRPLTGIVAQHSVSQPDKNKTTYNLSDIHSASGKLNQNSLSHSINASKYPPKSVYRTKSGILAQNSSQNFKASGKSNSDKCSKGILAQSGFNQSAFVDSRKSTKINNNAFICNESQSRHCDNLSKSMPVNRQGGNNISMKSSTKSDERGYVSQNRDRQMMINSTNRNQDRKSVNRTNGNCDKLSNVSSINSNRDSHNANCSKQKIKSPNHMQPQKKDKSINRGIMAQNNAIDRGIGAQSNRGIMSQTSRGIAAQNSCGIATENSRGIAVQNSHGIAAQNSRGIAAQNSRGIAAQNSRGIMAQNGTSHAQYFSDSEEDYDSDMNSFIDDSEQTIDESVRQEIYKSLRFDPNKYEKVNSHDDCRNMESSAKEIQLEEAKSKRIAREEDMKEQRLEDERIKMKEQLKKHRSKFER